jgi:hypothetical protein
MKQLMQGKLVTILFHVFQVGDMVLIPRHQAETEEEAEAWIVRNLHQEHLFHIRKVYTE